MARRTIRYGLGAASVLAASFTLSFIHPTGDPGRTQAPAGSFLAGAQLPPRVRDLIAQKCVDCHSEQVRWPVYSRFAPASWLVENDINTARERWNLSRWNQYSLDEQVVRLSQLASRAKVGSMPPVRYTLLHPNTSLTAEERVFLYEWAKAEQRRLRSMARDEE